MGRRHWVQLSEEKERKGQRKVTATGGWGGKTLLATGKESRGDRVGRFFFVCKEPTTKIIIGWGGGDT